MKVVPINTPPEKADMRLTCALLTTLPMRSGAKPNRYTPAVRDMIDIIFQTNTDSML